MVTSAFFLLSPPSLRVCLPRPVSRTPRGRGHCHPLLVEAVGGERGAPGGGQLSPLCPLEWTVPPRGTQAGQVLLPVNPMLCSINTAPATPLSGGKWTVSQQGPQSQRPGRESKLGMTEFEKVQATSGRAHAPAGRAGPPWLTSSRGDTARVWCLINGSGSRVVINTRK